MLKWVSLYYTLASLYTAFVLQLVKQVVFWYGDIVQLYYLRVPLHNSKGRGARVAQWVKHPSLGFSLGLMSGSWDPPSH